MRFAAAELALVLRLFRADLGHQTKRILLTVLAIAWGTLSIVILLSFGEGLKRSLSKGSRGMGEGIAVVWPGNTTKAWMGLPSGRPIPLKEEDPDLLRARIPEIALLSVELSKWVPVTVGTKTLNVRVRGVDPEFGELRNIHPQAGGRFLDRRDLEEKRRVVFLGEVLATNLFGTEDVVGKTVQINQSTFLVVGVAQKKIQMGMYNGPDREQACIPAPTFKSTYTDAKIQNLVYRPSSLDLADTAKAQVYRVMGAKYHFDPEDTRSLGIWDTREMQRINDNVGLGIQIFLGIIGGLTLFVGGMGVANIMFAVVKERTREIGVKMALGAKERQVMLPFLLEALVMTVVGGLVGTTVSLGLIAAIAALPLKGEAFDLLGRPTFSPAIAAATAMVLGTIGSLAGFFPAKRAASVNPAVSLRYE
jgi:putative ABC transport system permease protein